MNIMIGNRFNPNNNPSGLFNGTSKKEELLIKDELLNRIITEIKNGIETKKLAACLIE